MVVYYIVIHRIELGRLIVEPLKHLLRVQSILVQLFALHPFSTSPVRRKDEVAYIVMTVATSDVAASKPDKAEENKPLIRVIGSLNIDFVTLTVGTQPTVEILLVSIQVGQDMSYALLVTNMLLMQPYSLEFPKLEKL